MLLKKSEPLYRISKLYYIIPFINLLGIFSYVCLIINQLKIKIMAKKNKVVQENVLVTPTNEWKNLHVFGYGETKLIYEDEIKDIVVSTSALTKAQALIDFVYGKKPIDLDAGLEFHAITIVKDIYCLYIPKNNSEKYFKIEYKNMDANLIQDLVSELELLPSLEN